jgi:aldehyde:ferredoxin oxidoreductase
MSLSPPLRVSLSPCLVLGGTKGGRAVNYNGQILRVDLTQGRIWTEKPEERFYRTYFGGWGFIAYTLLRELKPHADPLGPENLLIFAPGVVTGAPLAGSGRHAVGAKSPLSGAFGAAEAGGFWGTELKRAGFDALVVSGAAERPVYLWIHDGEAEIREASPLWGQPIAETGQAIGQELGEEKVRVAAIGPAGERLVRYACIVHDRKYVAGRTGLGAVMGAKRLKAIAVRGRGRPRPVSPERVRAVARWLAENVQEVAGGLANLGTGVDIPFLNATGGLPTRNFTQGSFEGFEKITAETVRDTIRVGMDGCYACPIRCKKVVQLAEPYKVNATYGGPEYETLAALGSLCGIDDLGAIAKGHELCNAYGLDTISTGNVIAFAMECHEKGLLTKEDTGGLELVFGNARAMLRAIELIAERRGIGNLLAEGAARAAREIGPPAQELAMHVKGQEIPMQGPRTKHGLGLGYTVSPTGADHSHSLYDTSYAQETPALERIKTLGILEPLPEHDLSPAKVRLALYHSYWSTFLNCAVLCRFLPYSPSQVVEVVNGVSGWNSTAWELMKIGERAWNMARAFNVREGFTTLDDAIPARFASPFADPRQAVPIAPQALEQAKRTYYEMAGWEPSTGVPTVAKLQELGIGWVADRQGQGQGG